MIKKFIIYFLAISLILGGIYFSAVAQSLNGDVNGDSAVNTQDVLILRKYLAKHNVQIKTDMADINNDNKVNATDVLLLRRYLANIIKSLPTKSVTTTTTTTTESTTKKLDEWVMVEDFESYDAGVAPDSVLLNSAFATRSDGFVSINSLTDYTKGDYYYSYPNSLDSSSTKALGVTGKSNYKNAPKQFEMPTLINIKRSLSDSTNLRATFHLKDQSNTHAEIVRVGFFYNRIYYSTVIDVESYHKHAYFYFVGKTYKGPAGEEYVLTSKDLKSIRRIVFYVESGTSWGNGTTTLSVDNIESYVSDKEFDSSAYDAALPKTKPIDRTDSKKYLTLTFDDGPTKNMSGILDVLKDYKAKATFFVLGKSVTADTGAVLKRAVDEGSEIGNHTFNHVDLTSINLSEEDIIKEIKDTADVVEQYAGVRPKVYRPPLLASNSNVLDTVNLPSIGGHCPNDYSGSSLEFKEAYIAKFCAPNNGIILLHDTVESNIALIRKIIPYYQSLGFEFVTISEAFEKIGNTPYPILYESIN